MIATDYIFGKKGEKDAIPVGFQQEGLVFNFDSKDSNSYNPLVPDRWTDLITGKYVTSNAAEKFNVNEGAINLTNQGEYLQASSSFNIPAGDFSFGFFGKITSIFDVAGGVFRDGNTAQGANKWFFYKDNLNVFCQVSNNSFMGEYGSATFNYPLFGSNHYYSFSFTGETEIYRTGTMKLYRDGDLFYSQERQEGGSLGHNATNTGFNISRFNYNYTPTQSLGQFLKSLHAYSRELTAEEMKANSDYLHNIHNI